MSTTSAPTAQPLWAVRAPLALGNDPADVPTITPYPAADPTGAAVVVCPGGGYATLAGHEGEPIARWLNSIGVTAFVLRYRVAPRYRHPAPMLDAQRAIRTVRARAAEWAIDPKRVGVLGFSAGGHLAATVSNLFTDAPPPGINDPIEQVSSRPDLSILCYPVISFAAHCAHGGSRDNLLGPGAAPDLVASMSLETRVTPRTPPTFIFHTVEDAVVLVDNVLMYGAALRRANVPFEMHIYEHGQHGVGLAQDDPVLSTWTRRCAGWLARRGWAHPPAPRG